MRRVHTVFFLALAGLSACGKSEAPSGATGTVHAETSTPATTDPAAPVARITASEAAAFGNIYPVTVKLEKGELAGGSAIDVLTPTGERVPGTIELPANTPKLSQGELTKVTLVLKQPATFTDALLTPQGAVASYADAKKLLAPPEATKPQARDDAVGSKGKDNPNNKTGKSVQFTCTLDGKSLSTTSQQGLSMGAGHEVVYLGQSNKDLLAYLSIGPQGGSTYSNTPVDGGHLALDKLKPEDTVTLVLSLGSEIPDDAQKALRLTLAAKGITKDTLTKLPLTLPIMPSTLGLTTTPVMPAAEAVAQFAYDVYYVGTGGELVVESIDLANRSIRGTVRADLRFETVGGKGEKLFGDTVSITDGRFDISPLPVPKAPAAKKTASASH